MPVAAILAALAFAAGGCGKAAPPPAPTTVAVERGRFVETIAASGRVVPRQSVEIKCKASGQVAEVPVESGSRVKRGDLLLQLDPVDERRSVETANTALAAARARVEQSRLSLAHEETALALERRRAAANATSAQVRAVEAGARAKRLESLLAKELASAEETEAAQAARASAQAELAVAGVAVEDADARERLVAVKRAEVVLAEAELRRQELALAEAEKRLADTRIEAPIEGTVTKVKVEVGQIISSGITTVGGGTEVMTLADLTRLGVQVELPESDVGRVKPGQAVQVAAEAYPGRRFAGKVASIASEGDRANDGKVTFAVSVALAGDDLPLRPQMTVSVEITTVDVADAVLVPVEAVRRKDGKAMVAVRKTGGGSEERQVELGGTDGTKQQILSGLEAGENVEMPPAGKNRWRDEMHIGF